MSTKIKLRRGNEADIPVLEEGEPGFTLDSHKLFIGDGATNHEVGGSSTGGGVDLEKILLFDTSTSTVIEYSADEAGLDSAIAGSEIGDVIQIPNKTIAYANESISKTIPAGVTVRGLSREASIIQGTIIIPQNWTDVKISFENLTIQTTADSLSYIVSLDSTDYWPTRFISCNIYAYDGSVSTLIRGLYGEIELVDCSLGTVSGTFDYDWVEYYGELCLINTILDGNSEKLNIGMCDSDGSGVVDTTSLAGMNITYGFYNGISVYAPHEPIILSRMPGYANDRVPIVISDFAYTPTDAEYIDVRMTDSTTAPKLLVNTNGVASNKFTVYPVNKYTGYAGTTVTISGIASMRYSGTTLQYLPYTAQVYGGIVTSHTLGSWTNVPTV